MGDILQFAGVMAVVLGMPMALFYVMLPVAKRLGQRLGPRHAGDPDLLAEVDALRSEVDALRDVVSRVPELEERVDFAERLLAREREPAPLLADRNRENA